MKSMAIFYSEIYAIISRERSTSGAIIQIYLMPFKY